MLRAVLLVLVRDKSLLALLLRTKDDLNAKAVLLLPPVIDEAARMAKRIDKLLM